MKHKTNDPRIIWGSKAGNEFTGKITLDFTITKDVIERFIYISLCSGVKADSISAYALEKNLFEFIHNYGMQCFTDCDIEDIGYTHNGIKYNPDIHAAAIKIASYIYPGFYKNLSNQ